MRRWFTVLLLMLWPALAIADVVVLNTGETFNTRMSWQESGKVKFYLHGLVVAVDKADVVRIDKAGAGRPPTAAPHLPLNTKPAQTAKPLKRPPAISRKAPAPKKPPVVGKHKPVIKPPTATNLHTPTARQATRKIAGLNFRRLKWQIKPSAIPGLKKIKTEPLYGGVDQYWCPDEAMALGRARLDGIVYGFWRNRLYSIMMWVDGPAGFSQLQKEAFDRFGPGTASKTHSRRFVWASGDTERMLEFDENLNTGILWMRSRKLNDYLKKQYPD